MSGTSNKVITNRKTAGAVYIQYGLNLFDSKSVVVVNEITECSNILWDENDRKVAIKKVDKRDKKHITLILLTLRLLTRSNNIQGQYVRLHFRFALR